MLDVICEKKYEYKSCEVWLVFEALEPVLQIGFWIGKTKLLKP